jgi:TolB-like protein
MQTTITEIARHDSEPKPELVRCQLARILGSEIFARSRRMQRFLEFVVEETLSGRESQIGEYSIGVAVFDRGADFEPMLDPIVRNDARRLRFKLLEYYRLEQDGTTCQVIIEIPKGGYVPAFRARPSGRVVELDRPPETRRVAVLPFEVLSTTPECAMAGRVLSMSLTAGLTNLQGVEAVAYGYLRELSLHEAAAELRLSHVIQGSIMEVGDRRHLIVNLIHVPSGTQLWAREYQSEAGGTIVFQSEITHEISGEVAARLALQQPEPLRMAQAA